MTVKNEPFYLLPTFRTIQFFAEELVVQLQLSRGSVENCSCKVNRKKWHFPCFAPQNTKHKSWAGTQLEHGATLCFYLVI